MQLSQIKIFESIRLEPQTLHLELGDSAIGFVVPLVKSLIGIFYCYAFVMATNTQIWFITGVALVRQSLQVSFPHLSHFE